MLTLENDADAARLAQAFADLDADPRRKLWEERPGWQIAVLVGN